jgi:hypothetical protein
MSVQINYSKQEYKMEQKRAGYQVSILIQASIPESCE